MVQPGCGRRCNLDYMITNEMNDRVRGWFTGRVPESWQAAPVTVSVDREDVIVTLALPDVDLPGGDPDGASDAVLEEARAGRTKAFREDTRAQRVEIAREAEHRFERSVSWQVSVGGRTELFTHVSAPVMTRLRQPQRQVLDTLVEAGVARSRSEALGWCVRLVGRHEDDWLAELREAMASVADVRAKGPA
jgi:Arc/MetJ-type ribon-helix-helix transcriptional regulator